jgi:signal transduction histidine kinase/ActR/RegA family two-component response regulator
LSYTATEQRVLALLPNPTDGERTGRFLAAVGIPCTPCKEMSELCRLLREGAGAILLAEESLLRDTSGHLREALSQQPTWSAVPLIVLVRETTDARLDKILSGVLANVTLVERPVRQRTLLSGVRAALRARWHQYEIRDSLAEREQQALALRQAHEELARQAEQLREADRRKDEFLATLAHELRNPLAPLRTGLDVLKTAPGTEAAGRAREMMDRQLGHMVRLIDDLLDISRITLGKLILKPERLTLRSVIDAAVEASRPAIDAAHHLLLVSLPDAPIWLEADRTRLAQVVGNLLNNAAKYTPRGGRLEVRARREGNDAVIEVQDSGIGIPPETISEAFQLFSQLNRTLDRAQGGLGIGLALVRKLLDAHGGTIEAKSEGLGRGCTFTVRVPALPEAPVATSARPGEAPTLQQAQRVLVVDDNYDAADSLSMLLEALGHQTRTAHSGPEAVVAAEEFLPDLIFLDIGLPGLSGYEVARRLRKRAEIASAMLVALTGWGKEEDRRKALEAGFDVHLTKPVDLKAIETVLAKSTNGRGPSPPRSV